MNKFSNIYHQFQFIQTQQQQQLFLINESILIIYLQLFSYIVQTYEIPTLQSKGLKDKQEYNKQIKIQQNIYKNQDKNKYKQKMKFLSFTFLALIAFCAVQAQNQEEIDFLNCLDRKQQYLQVPCKQDNSLDCLNEQQRMKTCTLGCSNSQVFSAQQTKNCLQKCSSTNAEIQNNLQVVINCLSSTFLQFAFVFAFSLMSMIF
ncbi:transmembrane protein, putative (macronuclear) [Tetrahymena thermophila SB210]|uniref:Transmembrane protein, putative n=1 Tax=Tetrahymena thermophila (strain SB210) TaxID=312017 RepID=Q23J92_TETTS|nr:transmembrane protein, putative [Tetrahymena thermophila SB210]EAR96612.2 transmembrane protein, putative [Tetrahymena thermophila SB210]|eukprot:XP_001016857.2 transmembrane protein, putative [Tetrahymena thermophila SB210]